MAKKIKIINSNGINKDPWSRKKNKMQYQYDVTYPGFKYNFTDIQSAIGIEQLKKLRSIVRYRKKLREFYLIELKDLLEKKIIKTQKINIDQDPAFYIFTILLNKKKTNKNRVELIEYLRKNKINTTVHYIPANKHLFYKKKLRNFKLENTNYVYENIISLPFHNHLKKNDVKFICNKIQKFFTEK